MTSFIGQSPCSGSLPSKLLARTTMRAADLFKTQIPMMRCLAGLKSKAGSGMYLQAPATLSERLLPNHVTIAEYEGFEVRLSD